jgi:cystathionine beta-lyase/cystathionine gamma-synthase
MLYMTDNFQTLQKTIQSRKHLYINGLDEIWKNAKPVLEKTSRGETILRIMGFEVMSDYKRPYMEKLAEVVTRQGGNILNIGYGLGILDKEIEKYRNTRKLQQHYVIELNKHIAEQARQTENLIVIENDWRKALHDIRNVEFDGIVYDGFPLEKNEIHRDAILFIEELVQTKLLKHGGILTFYTDAAHFIGEKFIRYLKGLNLYLVDLEKIYVSVPQRERQIWKEDHFLVPIVRNGDLSDEDSIKHGSLMKKDYELKKNNTYSIGTDVVHAGEGTCILGAVCPPIFQSSTYLTGNQKSYYDGQYIRLNNTPDHRRLHKKISTLEKGEDAVVTSSGMAAISITLQTLLQSGSHILAQKCLYGATHRLLAHHFPALDIKTDFIDTTRPHTWKTYLKPDTQIIYVESMANPLLEVGDLRAVADFAREHNLISIIDNTFATPVNFNPLTIGFDVVIHSCSKYLNGHLDIVAGCVIGQAPLIKKVTECLDIMGSCLDPHTCFLLARGISTLLLRVERQNTSAMRIAEFLENHAAVERVLYPGLESHLQHHIAKTLFRGYSGVLSFELKGDVNHAEQFLSHLKLVLNTPSLGGVKTLMTRPASTSHSALSAAERREMGLSDKLLRLSTGIESVDDLIRDIEQALNKKW